MVVHEVAYPPGALRTSGIDLAHATPSSVVRSYPFELDEFQRLAVTCIEHGASVLVAAHTSAGKTVCAEHAIAMALRNGQRVIYSSPIKALSNQKYRELKESFQDVGLITGDVTISEDASCLVMTTEVLRMMLYKGSTAMRETKWVIFDEVHLLNSPDRGWVIEEALILLPSSVHVVLLSATVPNAFEVAEWVASLHNQPTHVIRTEQRPIPLRHYVCPLGGSGLHLVQDETAKFREPEWQSAIAGLPQLPTVNMDGAAKNERPRSRDSGSATTASTLNRAAEVIRVVSGFDTMQMLPAIIFCFSRKECELIATQMAHMAGVMKDTATAASTTTEGDGNGQNGANTRASGLHLLDEADIARIEAVYDATLDVLSDDDAQLPQVRALLPMLRCGIGLHHSGMLPVLRELVELLFTEGMLRVLYATETLAMGLNLPARTVVFSSPYKFDGYRRRPLLATEYTQMSGRAGRRGLDVQGFAVVLLSHQLSTADGEQMLSSRHSPLKSQFVLRFSTVLRLGRTDGGSALAMLQRSLRSWQVKCESARRGLRRYDLIEELRRLNTEAVAAGALHALAESYLSQRAALHHMSKRAARLVRNHIWPMMVPGRVLQLHGDRGWAVLVSTPSIAPQALTECGQLHCPCCQHGCQIADTDASAASMGQQINVLVHQSCKRRRGDADVDVSTDTAMKCRQGHPPEMAVVVVPIDEVRHLSAVRLWVPRDLQSADARSSVAMGLDALMDAFEGDLPLLDPIEHMCMNDPMIHDLIHSIEAAEGALRAHVLHRPCGKAHEAYLRCHRIQRLQLELARMDHFAARDPPTSILSDRSCMTERAVLVPAGESKSDADVDHVLAMSTLLSSLEYTDGNGVLQVKGRAACCIESANELLTIEMSCLFKHSRSSTTYVLLLIVAAGSLTHGVLNELSVPEMVAFVTCLLPGQREGSCTTVSLPSTVPLPTSALEEAVAQAKRTLASFTRHVAHKDADMEESTPHGRAPNELSVDLMPAIHAWASGAQFKECWMLTPGMYEGTLVRILRALDEFLRQLRDAAMALGNQFLADRFQQGAVCIHHGIPFANSLYLADCETN